MVITLSNLYVLMLQYFYMLNNRGVNELRRYVKLDSERRSFEEKSLNVVNVKEEDNFKDESLEVEKI